MKRVLTFGAIGAMLLLAGCVSPESANQLAVLQQQCAAGDPDACTAANYQAQANQQELQNNSAIAAGIIGGVLLGGVVVGEDDCCWGPGGVYRHGWHGAGFYGRGGAYGGRPGFARPGGFVGRAPISRGRAPVHR